MKLKHSYLIFVTSLQHNKMSFLLQVLVTLLSIAAITAQRNSNKIGTTRMTKLKSTITCETKNKCPGKCVRAGSCWIENRTVPPQDLNVCFLHKGNIYICCPKKYVSIMKENKSCVGGKYKPKKPPKRKKYGNSTDRARSAKSMQTKINPPGCGKRPKTNRDQELIAGGIEAEKHSWPWMASIRLRTYGGDLRHICGGSLITQRHTLTAAHCVIKNGLSRSPSNFRVVLGGHYRKRQSDPSLEEGIIIATPIALIIHKDYRENYDNDLAIMVLDAAVPINDFINIICLPTPPKYEEVSGSVTVIGWGYTSEVGSMSKTLREVTVRVIPTRRCQYIFRNWKSISRITDNMLCAGELSGEKDSCSHDSGGPLMKYDDKKNKWFEVGIVSFGYGCATRGYPGVYVRVSRFMPWIQQVVKDTARYSLNRKIPL